ncbi:uncharacterized protein EDB91DRAFT_1254528 [Suillus paluster]|uniref:uncharacterized protein n=1 Tax=Suillus paluster TaxID=48578 RepID=UPI001B868716|nr:uncharacterized protein EDB91DRAFT_1254528 [Suillus paluster]KAG1726015.1 hypothetical protein EDB91DRAFT_1254528 [Suillus paluster]
MGRKKKDTGITIPEITWTNDLIWKLLAEIELPENRVVLLGKWKKCKNTSDDSKATVYQCMAAVIFLQFHNLNPTVTGDCVKCKYEHKDSMAVKHHSVNNSTVPSAIPAWQAISCRDPPFP